MAAFILIVVLQEWGAGIGSTGNAITMQEFSSKKNCEAAASAIEKIVHNRSDHPYPICVPK